MSNRIVSLRALALVGMVPLWMALKAAIPPAAPSIAMVDVRKLINEHPQYLDAQSAIESWRAARQQELDRAGEQLKLDEADMETLKPGSDKFRERAKELLLREKTLQFEMELLNVDLERRRSEALRDAFVRVQQACDRVRRERDLDLVVQYNPLKVAVGPGEEVARDIVQRPILAFRDQLDITGDVLAILNP